MRWTYRLRQFLRQVMAHKAPKDLSLACEVLSGDDLALFEQMSPGDRAHALCVLQALRRQARMPQSMLSSDLERASLLHDVGKTGTRLTAWHRGTATLLQAVAPQWLRRLSTDDAHSWRYPFYVHLSHAEMGAEACRRTGCTPRTIAIVRYHESEIDEIVDAINDPVLRAEILALKETDDVC